VAVLAVFCAWLRAWGRLLAAVLAWLALGGAWGLAGWVGGAAGLGCWLGLGSVDWLGGGC